MNNYTFLKENYNEDGITRYFAISRERIETLKVSETYDRNGQLVSPIDAGGVISSFPRKNELIELIKTLIPEVTTITPDSLTTFGFNLAELKSLFK